MPPLYSVSYVALPYDAKPTITSPALHAEATAGRIDAIDRSMPSE
jgi:hypothetical protein